VVAETQRGTRAEEKWKSLLENRRKRPENLLPAPPHPRTVHAIQPSELGGEDDVGTPSTAGLAARRPEV